MTLSCHCGQLCIETAKRPDFIHECNCSLCAKSGVRWGYFEPSELTIVGETRGYRRTDKPNAGAIVHSCSQCGFLTHFTLADDIVAQFGNSIAGVNMRLADESELAGIELRFPDGKAWAGEGPFHYVRVPRIIGQ